MIYIGCVLVFLSVVALVLVLMARLEYYRVYWAVLDLAQKNGKTTAGARIRIETIREITGSIDSPEAKALLVKAEAATVKYVKRFRLFLAILIPMGVFAIIMK